MRAGRPHAPCCLLMKRWFPMSAALVIAVGLLVALGPARLRPWECREIKAAASARGAMDAYYQGCWTRPALDAASFDLGPGSAGNEGEGYGDWHHLVEFRVRYDAHTIRFLLVGQHEAGGPWRAVQGEGTGP